MLSIYEVVGIAMASLVIFLLLRPIGARLKGLVEYFSDLSLPSSAFGL